MNFLKIAAGWQERKKSMWQISLYIFLILFGIFIGIMLYEPRTLWSGIAFFWTMVWMVVFLFCTLYRYSEWLASHDGIIGMLILLFILAMGCIIVFPAVLIVMFFVEGIKVIRHEGLKMSNLLSMLFSVLLFVYLAVWPAAGSLGKNKLSTALYIIISFSAVYILSLMAVYSLSAVLNLIHFKRSRNADYIIVLGSGIAGKKVTPLLAARIEKGIELMHYNPKAVLIMSGGQGPGEEIPESEAMAAYAKDKGVDTEKIILERKSVSTEENLLFSKELMDKEKPKIIIVTTAYHVLRALVLAKQQEIKCIGFGAKTKWYFTLNAFIREFAGYLSLTRKRHIAVIGIVACIVAAVSIMA